MSGGKFKCNKCNYVITMLSASSLPPCPNCKSNNTWKNLSG
ncbi:zinc ribbon-containing protein, partial [Helicobacter typhlonius]